MVERGVLVRLVQEALNYHCHILTVQSSHALGRFKWTTEPRVKTLRDHVMKQISFYKKFKFLVVAKQNKHSLLPCPRKVL